MFKRRATLENGEKQKRNKITECCLDLEKCLQIPSDDRLQLRRKIKDGDTALLALFDTIRRDRDYGQLQLRLRKFLQMMKGQQKRTPSNRGSNKTQMAAGRLYSQNSQSASVKVSLGVSPEKQEPKRKIISFDISDLKRRIEQQCGQKQTKISPAQKPIKSSFPKRIEEESMLSQVTQRLKQNRMRRDLGIDGKLAENESCTYRGNKNKLADITNIGYSSSIKNLLKSKLMKDIKKTEESSFLKEEGSVRTIQKQTSKQQLFARREPSLRLRNRQKGQQISCSLRLFVDKKQPNIQLEKEKKLQEQPIFGSFFQKIRNIIEKDDF